MLGENIRNLRKENKISQEDLAEKLGISRQSVSLWETGKTQPTLELVTKLAELFGISTDELLNGEIEMESSNNGFLTAANQRKLSIKRMALISVVILIIFSAVFFIVRLGNHSFLDNSKAIEEKAKSIVLLNCYNKDGELCSTGSGFLLLEQGLIVTNYHVIENSVYEIEVNTESGETIGVKSVVVYTPKNDIAILRCAQPINAPILEIGGSTDLHKGDKVVAIGSPLGIINSVSTGVFSGYIDEKIQFSASISAGSSGGALFDKKGKVIGITYASFEEGQNLNLAIPIEKVVDLWEEKDVGQEKSLYKLQAELHGGVEPSEFLKQKAKEGAEKIDEEFGENAYGGSAWLGID